MKLWIIGFSVAVAMSAAAAGDRVYTADQTSNTVSVIDPAANKLLGSIHLGEDVPAALSPLYRGELLVHGLGFSPDHKTLDVVSIGSNSVTLIDTQTNTRKGKIYVGRSPHEAFVRPDGGELYVAVRGEDYVSVIDPAWQKKVRQIETANAKLRFNLLPQVSMISGTRCNVHGAISAGGYLHPQVCTRYRWSGSRCKAMLSESASEVP